MVLHRTGGPAVPVLVAAFAMVVLTVHAHAKPARAAAAAGAATDSARAAAASADDLLKLPGAQSVAVNDDGTALFVNPAAINRSIPAGYYFAWEDGRGGETDLAVVGLTAGPLGLGYQQLRPEGSGRVDRWAVALGGNTREHLSAGVRVLRENWRMKGPDDGAWRWTAGLLWRPAWWASFGATGDDLTQGDLYGHLLHRRYTLGFGLRPLRADDGARLTLFGDLSGGEREVWRLEAVARAGVEAEPFPGVAISAAFEGPLGRFWDERTLRFGLRLNRRHASPAVGIVLNQEDRHSRTVLAISGATARQRTSLPQPVLAELSIAGTYADESQSGLSIPIPFIGSPSYKSIRPVMRQLETAETDPDVRGVLLEIGAVRMGALSDEVSDQIRRVRASGKPVVAYMDGVSGIGAYLVASACDRIVLDPAGGVDGLGIRADILYFGEMLDSAGVEFEKVQHGKYKTAFENLTRRDASEGQRESIEAVLDDLRAGQLDRLAEGRRLDRGRLAELCDGRLLRAAEAREAGLVDTLGNREDARKLLARLAGRPETSVRPVSVAGWEERRDSWADGPMVAVLWLDGGIEAGHSRRGLFGGNSIGARTVSEQLRQLKKDGDIRAVVLRIDSPGGDGSASDQIWRAVDDLRAAGKPVVASMSRVAASGGYYIACGADEIFADPSTITGSIGVFGMKFNLARWYARHRINVETFERGGMMGIYSTAVPLDPAEEENLQEFVDAFYWDFIDRVAAGRPLDRDAIDAVAQGRIWTGRQARERRLIDRLGGLREAVVRARELAGLPEDARVKHLYRPEGSWWWRLASGEVAITLPWGRWEAGGDEAPRSLSAESDAARLVGWVSPGLAPGVATDPFEVWWRLRVLSGRGVSPVAAASRAEEPLAVPLADGY